jgi:carboxyl-terminal processing protease
MKLACRISSRSQTLLYGGVVVMSATFALLNSARDSLAQIVFQDSPKAVLDQAWQIVNDTFVDGDFNGANWQAVRQDLLSRDYSSSEAAYTALQDALKQLDDPYTRFMDPAEYQAFFDNHISGELSGIGIRLEVDERTQALTIMETIENSPAREAGLQPGDRLLSIAGQSTESMPLERASRLIRGEAGTALTLNVKRANRQPFDLSITRARIEIENVNYSVREEGDARIGYIRLREFATNTPAQMREAIQTLSKQKVNAFVLDLRDNRGGSVQASVEIARMWLDDGVIVKTVNRVGHNTEYSSNQTALTQLPLAVLVNGSSASASEIVTGALKDNRRAVIVGSKTFGKALVQNVRQLADGSGLAVTIAHYYTPNGTDISHRGIVPNVVSTVSEQEQQRLAANHALRGAGSDSQYRRAISVLQATLSRAASSS